MRGVTIKKAVRDGSFFLGGLSNSKLEAEVLLCAILDENRTYLKIHSHKLLSIFQFLRYKYWLKKRKNRIPASYIIGYKKWAGLKIRVNKHTLIPRDETEILCHHICAEHREYKPRSVLDIGTGSGAIGIFLTMNLPGEHIYSKSSNRDTAHVSTNDNPERRGILWHNQKALFTALDISSQALKIAQINAKCHGVNINFIQSDLLESIPYSAHFDIIVANLPYVPDGLDVDAEVYQEPSTAIFGGADGLDCIRQLSEQIEEKQVSFRELWIEFLPVQKDMIASIFCDKIIKFYGDEAGDIYFAKIT